MGRCVISVEHCNDYSKRSTYLRYVKIYKNHPCRATSLRRPLHITRASTTFDSFEKAKLKQTHHNTECSLHPTAPFKS
jgi:hypothetical protein